MVISAENNNWFFIIGMNDEGNLSFKAISKMIYIKNKSTEIEWGLPKYFFTIWYYTPCCIKSSLNSFS